MRHALIPPISLLSTTFRTDYQLMLPHLVSEDPSYVDVYRKHCEDPDTYVILDNGVAEEQSIQLYDLLNTAASFGVDEVVLPDVMCNGIATLKESFIAYQAITAFPSLKHLKTMFVAQGQSYGEVYATIRSACSLMPDLCTIGLPRHLVTTIAPGARWTIVREIHNWSIMRGKEIHFLGMNGNYIRELEGNHQLKIHVRGVDSSAPFNYAYEGELMGDHLCKACARPERYFFLAKYQFDHDALLYNMNYLKEV